MDNPVVIFSLIFLALLLVVGQAIVEPLLPPTGYGVHAGTDTPDHGAWPER